VDINNSGTVLVNLYAADRSEEHALLWSHDGVVDLGSLGGSRSRAIAINDSGTVLGRSENAAGEEHPFLWQRGRMTDLAPAGGAVDVQALNQAGDVAGQVDGHPALWRHGVLDDILDGRPGVATALNDRGDIAGTTYDPALPDVIHTPFRWRNGTVASFGLLFPGLVGTWVNAVDDRGRVIGISPAQGGAGHVVVWTAR
jgi:probable HAF family extracellular repeat protein